MAVGELDEGLLDHLVVEFLDHGRRAVGFLHSAQALLAAPPADVPCVADTVAYCLREAMKAIPESQDVGGGGQWRARSRSVIEAKEQYERTRDLPGGDSDAALQELLTRIDAMGLTHQEASIHQRRLIAVVVNRTGTQPLAAGMDPAGFYQDILSRLDNGVHRGLSMGEARRLWADCLAILRQLFLPPEVRNSELDALASIGDPGPSDVSTLVSLLASPNHLRYFLSKIESPAWLVALSESELLEPPAGQAAWPVLAAVPGLKDNFGGDLAAILQRMLERWGSHPQKAWYITQAAVEVGEHGRGVVLSAVRQHPDVSQISWLATLAATRSGATDTYVSDVADVVLNPTTWTPYPDLLLAALVDGMTADNSRARITLLSYKLRKVPPNDHERRYFSILSTSLDEDVPDYVKRKPFYALLHTLILSLRKAGEWAHANAILDAMSPLPDDIKGRVRIWLLATAPSVEQSDLIRTIVEAIPSRNPTRDDLRIVDRVIAESNADNYIPAWTATIGAPPTVTELSASLAAGEVAQSHRYIFGWSAILPEPVTAAWATATAIMSAAYGSPASRQSLEQSTPTVTAGFYGSPIGEADLRAMSPEEGARWIAAWRPDSSHGLVSPLELARTLQAVVKADTAPWVSTPLTTASLLRHPTYIHHYMQGLAEAESLAGAPVGELIDLIVLVRAHPWPAVALGNDPDDFDRDWRAAELACVQLIKKMASSALGFDNRRDEVWEILRAETENRTESSGILGDSVGLLESAINRPCTQALEAVLSFLGHEYRLDSTVRPEALDLLSEILHLDGRTGGEHRAILATRIGFLRYIAPDWFEQHRDQLFGDAAPSGLGQVTVDLAVRWGQPNKWLVENYPELIKDAVTRRIEDALDHYLVAMLQTLPGYPVLEAVRFLKSRKLLSSAGEAVGRLLQNDTTLEITEVAVQFWKAALNTNDSDSLVGFGWYAEIGSIDTSTWTDLILRTVATTRGRIDWAHKNAERAAAQPTTPKILDILNHLVRGTRDDWDRQEITKIAAQTLQEVQDLAETPEYKRLHTTLTERGAL